MIRTRRDPFRDARHLVMACGALGWLSGLADLARGADALALTGFAAGVLSTVFLLHRPD